MTADPKRPLARFGRGARALGLIAALACIAITPAALAQRAPGGAQGEEAQTGPIKTARYQATFVRLGPSSINGLLYEPATPGPNARVGVVYTYPGGPGSSEPAAEMASRGYQVLLVKHYLRSRRGEVESPLDGVEETSRAITYLRAQPGIERVVAMGWGAGAKMVTLYANVAEHGPAACQGPRLLRPCATEDAAGMAKADGLVLFDPGLGAFTLSDIDPAFEGAKRSRSDFDMYAAANGYDAKTGRAAYSAQFKTRYFAAQSARNNQIIDTAVARLKLVEQGQGDFSDDEPFLVPGAVNVRSVAALFRTDLTLLSRTKVPHTLLKADGTAPQEIVRSIRPPSGTPLAGQVSRCCGKANYGLKRFLTNDAVRTTPDFALTPDDILGVDWKTSNTATPANAEGVTVPTLVMTMTCFQFVVPSEITFDHLASRDKTFAAVEGAEHFFGPCKPEFGDTRKRVFDFVDGWLSKPGRF